VLARTPVPGSFVRTDPESGIDGVLFRTSSAWPVKKFSAWPYC
jgi:hypothetical protein